jgi:hypothetical protein
MPVPREEMVVDPLTVNVPVREVVARKELPETVKAVVEALANVDWPVTTKGPLTVEAEVEALVTVKTLVAELKVKLEEVPTALVPLPNRTSVEVRLAAPVPPLATDNWPCQPKVKALLAIEPVTLVPLMTKPTRVVPKVLELVPPLATGRMPVTSAVREAWPMNREPALALTTPVPKEDRVVEPLEATAKNGAVLVEDEAIMNKALVLPLVPWIASKAEGEVVPMPTREVEAMVKMLVPEELATLKIVLVPEPWMLKEMAEEVAPIPATLPLSNKAPLVRELVPFQMATLPLVPEPDKPLPAAAMVMEPFVVVVIVILVP